jgi:hypothetical protein
LLNDYNDYQPSDYREADFLATPGLNDYQKKFNDFQTYRFFEDSSPRTSDPIKKVKFSVDFLNPSPY